jgi:hypothetical protein
VSLFVCDECDTVENTALAGPHGYWLRNEYGHDGKARCSACNPEIGKWHGLFPRELWDESERQVVNRE